MGLDFSKLLQNPQAVNGGIGAIGALGQASGNPMLSSTAQGAQLGMTIGGPYGAAIGAAGGLVMGGVQQYMQRQAQREAEEQMSQARGMALNQAAFESTKPTLEFGGKLMKYKGKTHAEGGIQLAGAEVENNETQIGNVVFSAKLKPQGSKKTFAQLSEAIEKKFPRENDKFSDTAKKKAFANLFEQQEALKKEQGLVNEGEEMELGGWLEEDPIAAANKARMYRNDFLFTPTSAVSNGPHSMQDVIDKYNAVSMQSPLANIGYTLPLPSNDFTALSDKKQDSLPISASEWPIELESWMQDPNYLNSVVGVGNTNPNQPMSLANAANFRSQLLPLPATRDSLAVVDADNSVMKDLNTTTETEVEDFLYKGPSPILAALPNLFGAETNRRLANRLQYDRVTPQTADPNLLDPTRALMEANSSFAGVNQAISNNLTGGTGLTNRLVSAAAQAGTVGGIAADYEQRNRGILNQVGQFNASQKAEAMARNAAIQQEEMNNKLSLLGQAARGVSQSGVDAMTQWNLNNSTRYSIPFAGTDQYRLGVNAGNQIVTRLKAGVLGKEYNTQVAGNVAKSEAQKQAEAAAKAQAKAEKEKAKAKRKANKQKGK